MAEAEELEAVERERARRRKAEAGKANLPTVSAGNVSTTHAAKKGEERPVRDKWPERVRHFPRRRRGRQAVPGDDGLAYRIAPDAQEGP